MAAEAPEGKAKLPPGFGPQVDAALDVAKLPSNCRAHLEKLTEAYVAQTRTSKKLTQKYRRVHADPRTAAGFNRLWKELVYPIVVERSEGARLWDVDGNEYIDLSNGFGPNFFGHSHPAVKEALKAQLEKGFEIGPQTPKAGMVAELLCELTGNERVTFVNTGSEAVQAVIRAARTVTERDKIVVFAGDYHGNFDEVLVRGNPRTLKTQPLAPGIPRESVANVLVLEYGEEKSLEIIREHADNIAAVLVEPIQSRRPEFHPRAFIKALRELTRELGIVFVFDEVITGFRTGLGGAQEMYGVDADLVTYGKVLGGGMPIGAVAGKAKYTDVFDGGYWQYGDDSYPEAGVTFFAGTFVRHPLAMAAAHAALTWLKEHGSSLYPQLYWRTTWLASRLNRLFENYGVNIHVAHYSTQMYFRIKDENQWVGLLFYHARLRGVYMAEGFPSYLTIQHTDADVEKIVQVFEESLAVLASDGLIAVPEARSTELYPLTAAQHDVWIASQLSDAASCAYNESDTFRLEGKLETPRFVAAVQQAVGRHSALHTRFTEDGSQQYTDWSLKLSPELVDMSGLNDVSKGEELEKFFDRQASQPFDLSAGPPARLFLIKLSSELHLFVVYAHHIVFDGWSSEVLVNDIATLYNAFMQHKDVALTPARGYNEYAKRVAFDAAGDSVARAVAYWRKELAGATALELPTDFKRPKERKFLGSTYHHELAPELLGAARKAAKANGVTPQNVFLSAFWVLLSELARQPDLVIGIPTASQADYGEGELVGYGVNLLPLRIKAEETASLKQVMTSVRDKVLDGFEHRAAQFSDILKAVGAPRAENRSPLIDAVFNYSTYFDAIELEGLKVSAFENARKAINFDMFFNIVEMDEQLHVDWDYSTELFSEETIARWAASYEAIVAALAKASEQKVGELAERIREERRLAS